MPSTTLCSLPPLGSCIHSSFFSDWRHTVSSKFFDTQVPSISTEELVLPRHARCVLSHLRCNEHCLVLRSYLSSIGRIKNPSCSACRHSSQDTSNLILHCPATNSLCCSPFGDCLSLYDLWSRTRGVARLLGLHGLLPCPHPSEGVPLTFIWKTGFPDTSEMDTAKRVLTSRPNDSNTIRFFVNKG